MILRYPIAVSLIVGSALSVPTPATTTNQSTARLHTYAHGTLSCGDWTATRNRAKGEPTGHEAWVLGFVSGASWMAPGRLARTDAAAMFAYIDLYCQRAPLHQLVDAAFALVQELEKRPR